MNRRDALKAAAAVFAIGTDGMELTAQPETGDALVAVLTMPISLSQEHRECFRKDWEDVHRGSVLEKIPLVILQPGMTLKVYRRGEAEGIEAVNDESLSRQSDLVQRQIESCQKMMDELKRQREPHVEVL